MTHELVDPETLVSDNFHHMVLLCRFMLLCQENGLKLSDSLTVDRPPTGAEGDYYGS